MKHLRSLGLLRLVATFTLFFAAFTAHAQVQTAKYISTTANSGGFYEYLPAGYNSGTQTYPLIISIHGVGELGDGVGQLSTILYNGLPRIINAGQFPSSFNSNGQSFSFIVLSPQFKAWPSPNDINDVINYAIQRYRVNTNRIYVTGLSMGGGVTWDYANAFPSRIAAIVPVCGASWPDQTKAQNIVNGKVAAWGLHNDFDPTVPSSYTKDWITFMAQAGGTAKKTIFSSYSHDAWTQSYDPNYRENGMNVYEWMLQYQKGSSYTPPPAPTPTPAPAPAVTTVALPGKVEAENFSAMSGVQTEYTMDAGGGQDVGWIDPNDWMDYSVNPSTTGTYTVNFRVATVASNAQFQLRKADGTVLATVNVPNTGGYQNWQTVSATVNLSAGTQTLRFISTSPWGTVFNTNWMDFATGYSAIPAPAPSTSTPSTTTPGGTRIEAENYTSMSGVQTETTYDAGGGKDVGWIDPNDWMDYSINPSASGSYTMNFRVATTASTGQFQVRKADGTVLATVNVPNTGGYQNWQTVSATVNLSAGQQTIRLVSTSPWGITWNINWFEYAGGGSTGGSTSSPTPSTSGSRIEAENYASMSGVQKETTYDVGGGQDVGWIDNGDWMDYPVNVPTAGNYTLNLRIATPNTGAQVQIKSATGAVLSTATLPNTGAYQTWQTTSTTIYLQAGTQTIRLQSSAAPGWNINWMELAGGSSATASTSTPSTTTAGTTRVEAENYTSMSGIQTETTYDAGGGKNVGWIDPNDWMDYSINPSASGTYTMNFRVATTASTGQFQVRKADGTVLATVNVPNTGGYQNWQTVSATVNLSAGQQTIRLVSTSPWGITWNINWFEYAGGGAALAKQSQTTTTATTVAPATAMDIFPNPVSDKFVLQVNNDLTGTLDVTILNLQGSVLKQFSLTKGAAGSSQFYVSIGDLTAGNYIVKATMNGWTESKQISKL